MKRANLPGSGVARQALIRGRSADARRAAALPTRVPGGVSAGEDSTGRPAAGFVARQVRIWLLTDTMTNRWQDD
jgi:hypothetical protein